MMSTPFNRFPLWRLCCGIAMCAASGPAFAQHSLMSYDTPAYLEFSSPGYTVSEDQAQAVITVVRTGEYRIAVSVSYSTHDGTATAGEDYTAVSGTLTIPAGVGLVTFSVPIHADGANDGSETVQLKLSNPGPGAVIVHSTATLTITDPNASSSTPVLAVRSDGHGHIVLSWTGSSSCILERSDAAVGGIWVAVDCAPQVLNDVSSVTEPASEGNFFYRLRNPQ